MIAPIVYIRDFQVDRMIVVVGFCADEIGSSFSSSTCGDRGSTSIDSDVSSGLTAILRYQARIRAGRRLESPPPESE